MVTEQKIEISEMLTEAQISAEALENNFKD